MAFEHGPIRGRAFFVPQPFPKNHLEAFADHAAPPIDKLKNDPIHGWVSGRHLLERRIDEETAMFAGYLRLTLMQAERKVPESLLRAYVRMEELAQARARGVAELDRKTRLAIRKEIRERLLPEMPPDLKGMTFVYDHNNRILYAETLSDKQYDAFMASFRETLSIPLIPVEPASAAMKLRQLDIQTIAPCTFTPENTIEDTETHAGQDFLTWLWFHIETDGGIFSMPDGGRTGVMIEGPLSFVMEGEGAHETILRNGCPLLSAEAKTALLSGKKLKRACLQFARENDNWQLTVDADTFVFRRITLPERERTDPLTAFQERMLALHSLREMFLHLFERYLDARLDTAGWNNTLPAIHRWIKDRPTRA